MPLLAHAVAFLAGAALWLWLPAIEPDMLVTAALVGGAVAIALFWAGRSGFPAGLLRSFWPVVFFLAGFTWSGQAMWHQRQVLEETGRLIQASGRERTLTGTVSGLPVRDERRLRFVLRSEEEPPRRYLLSWFDPAASVHPGQRWRLRVKLRPPHGYINPGSFDYPRWLFRQQIVATGWVRSGEFLSGPEPGDLLAGIHKARENIRQWLHDTLPDSRARALLQALLIGDRSALDVADFVMFQRTGTAHLIAISGLHIGLAALLGAGLGFLIFFLWPSQRRPRPVVQAVLGMLCATAYAALAGFSVATVRALVGVVVVSVAVMMRRRLSAWDIWATALLLVLFLDPMAVLDTGFWLSFAAVAVLIAAFVRPPAHAVTNLDTEARQFGKARWLSWLASLGRAQLAVWLGLLPLSLVFFYQLSLLAPLVNLVLIPVLTVTLVPLLGLALLVHGVIGSFGMDELLLRGANTLAHWLVSLLQSLADWPQAVWPVPVPPAWWFVLWVPALVGWLLFRAWQWRLTALVVLVSLLWLLRWFGVTSDTDKTGLKLLDDGNFSVHVLDVGQGLSVLVETREHRLLYDTGAAFDTGFNLADAVLLPYFYQRGIRYLDTLVLSHRDNDHAGAASVLRRAVPVGKVLSTFPFPQTHDCVTGVAWTWNGVEFTVLSPYNMKPYLGNNSSCVLRVSSSSGSVLLTGDIGQAVEYRLVQAHRRGEVDVRSDVILVPHHGSATSSSATFIDTVAPRVAVNAAGFMNPFGHPKPDVVERYRQRRIQWLDTREQGMIRLFFGKNGLRVSTHAAQRGQRVWRLERPAGSTTLRVPDHREK